MQRNLFSNTSIRASKQLFLHIYMTITKVHESFDIKFFNQKNVEFQCKLHAFIPVWKLIIFTFPIWLHPGRGVNGVSKKTVPGHLLPYHSGTHWAWQIHLHHFYISTIKSHIVIYIPSAFRFHFFNHIIERFFLMLLLFKLIYMYRYNMCIICGLIYILSTNRIYQKLLCLQ